MYTLSYWRSSLQQSELYAITIATIEEQLCVNSIDLDDSWLKQKGKNNSLDVWISEAEKSGEEGYRNDDLSLYYLDEEGEITAAILAEDREEKSITLRKIFLRGRNDARSLALIVREFLDLLDEFCLDYEILDILYETDAEREIYEKMMGKSLRTEETVPFHVRGEIPADPFRGGLCGESLVKLNTLNDLLEKEGYNTTLLYAEMLRPVLGISCENSGQALLVQYDGAEERYIVSSLEETGRNGNFLYDVFPDGTPVEYIAEKYIIPAFELLCQEK